jgi:hypothetical protein
MHPKILLRVPLETIESGLLWNHVIEIRSINSRIRPRANRAYFSTTQT